MHPKLVRREQLLALVDPSRQKGLEIGALLEPVLDPKAGRTLFADIASTEGLRQRYAEHGRQGLIDLSALVEVDVVIGEDGLAAALGDRGPVDFIVASNVIEHVPDVIGWLDDMAECLAEGGHLCLAVPDKRFTFDHFRQSSTFQSLVEAWLGRWRHPSPGQVYDHVAHAAQVDADAVWKGETVEKVPMGGAGLTEARLLAAAQIADPTTSRDVHCTVWTPASFATVLGEAMAQDLVPFRFARFVPTPFRFTEFYVTLQKCSTASPAERAGSAPELGARHHVLPTKLALGGPRIRLKRLIRKLGMGHRP